MADRTLSLTLKLNGLAQVEGGLKRINGAVNIFGGGVISEIASHSRILSGFSAVLSQTAAAAAAGGPALAAAVVIVAALGSSLAGLAVAYKELKNTAEAFDEVGKAAQRAGVSVETLSALRFAAKLSEVDTESLGTALKFLNKNIAEAVAKPGSEAALALKALGISAVDASGKIRPTDEILLDIAQKFSQFKDGANKTALALALFGRSGEGMIPFLNTGSASITELTERAKTLGLVVSQDGAENAEKFNDSLTELKEGVKGVGYMIAGQFLPPMAEAVSAIAKYLRTHDDWRKAATFISNLIVQQVVALRVLFAILQTGYTVVNGFNDILFTLGKGALYGVIDLFSIWGKTTLSLIQSLLRLISVSGNVSEVLLLLAMHRFSDAFELSKQTVQDIGDELSTMGDTFASAMSDSGKVVKDSFTDAFTKVKAVAITSFDDILDTWNKTGSFIRFMQALIGGGAGKSFVSHVTDKADAPGMVKDISLQEQERKTKEEILKIEEKLAQLDSDFTKTDAEKWTQRNQLLELQRSKLQQIIDLEQKQADLAATPEERQQILSRRDSFQNQLVGVDRRIGAQGADPNSFFDQFNAKITQLQNQWGTTAQQMANVFGDVMNTAISSISAGITGLIEGTKSWGQALREIGTSILDAVIQGIVRMFVTWIVNMLVLKALQKVIGTDSTQQAAQSAAAWGPAAVAASIASYGAAAGVGTAAAVAGMAVGAVFAAALSSGAGSYAQGGYTGAGGKYDIAGVAHRGEVIWSQDDVSRAGGVSSVESMRKGGSSSQKNQIIHVNVFDDPYKLSKHLRSNPEAQHIIVDTMGRNLGRMMPRR